MSPTHADPGPRPPATRRGPARSHVRLALHVLGSLLLGWIAIWVPVMIIGKGVVPLVDALFQPGPDALGMLRRTGILLASVAGYGAYVRWHEKRRATELQLRPVALALGGAGGAALVGVPMLVLFGLGAYQVVQVNGIQSSLLGAAGVIAIAATLEELTFRCVLFRVLERHCGTAVALVLQAVLFSLQHVENVAQGDLFDIVAMLVSVTLTGLLWAGVFILTRNLWAVAAHHAAWNFTILLSGLPLSGIQDWRALAPLESRYAGPDWLTGGMFGPESSLVVIVLTSVSTAWLLTYAWRRAAFRRADMDPTPRDTNVPAGQHPVAVRRTP